MEKVIFEPNMTNINDTNKPQIDELVKLLKANPTLNISIVGYTDKSGIPEKNILISQKRAKAVYEYVVSQGIEPNRLSHQGLGDANPIAPNKYRWGRDKNRRIEVKITSL